MQIANSGCNPVISNIINNHPAQLGFSQAAAILNYTPAAAYVARARSQFPVRVRLMGKRLVVFTSDLVQYLESGESQASLSAPALKKVVQVKTGRPTKRESLEAQRLGITVKQLRGQGGAA